MTDNSPATDEQIAAWENETHIMPSDLYTFILSLIARIRAETANNSGEVVAWRWKYDTETAWTLCHKKPEYFVDRDIEPLYATPANSVEPVAWVDPDDCELEGN